MRGWLMANPDRRKTKRGISRFINNWLSREQDKGRISVSLYQVRVRINLQAILKGSITMRILREWKWSV